MLMLVLFWLDQTVLLFRHALRKMNYMKVTLNHPQLITCVESALQKVIIANHRILWLQWAHSPAEGVWCGQVWFYYLGKTGSAELGWLF